MSFFKLVASSLFFFISSYSFFHASDSAPHGSHDSPRVFSLFVSTLSFCLPFSLPHFFISSTRFLPPSVPAVLMSCPAIKGKRDMLILTPQCRRGRERSKKCQSSVALRVYVCTRTHFKRSEWVTFPVFLIFTLPSCHLNFIYINIYMCVCVGVRLLEQVANSKAYVHLFYFGI